MLIELLLQAGCSLKAIYLLVLALIWTPCLFGGLAYAVIYIQWQHGKWLGDLR